MKKPLWLRPSAYERQSYVVTNDKGLPMVRQSMRTDDGRVVYLELTPDEVVRLIRDLESARMDAVAYNWANGASTYPDARF